ncbi:MAG: HEPN domain-containing protein [Rhodocyclaceae bacterium]|nr:HEPN domain-containing protein [Rhodocyclaceae bacterium]
MNDKKFFWPAYPRSNADFEALMKAIDQVLAEEGLKPFQRPLHVARKLWEAFGWEGPIFPPKEMADQPGFENSVFMAKAYRWYDQYYGEQLKGDFAYGFAPTRLGNALWRVRAGLTYGTVRLFLDRNLQNRGVTLGGRGVEASFNVLCAVENLPQGLVDRLPEGELIEHFQFHVFMHESLQWREELPRTELFDMARADYDESTSSVLSGRNGQARWAAQQAVEKTLKGLLTITGTAYPTGGPNGHNLNHLAKLLETHHGIAIPSALLDLAACSPKVRYAEEPSTEKQSLLANHAVLGVLEQLRLNPRTEYVLRGAANIREK